MSDLATRLLAAIHETERDVREGPEWAQWNIRPTRFASRICAVLRRCAADRKIAELHTGGHECSVYGHDGEVDGFHYVLHSEDCSTLKLLAEGYGLLEEATRG